MLQTVIKKTGSETVAHLIMLNPFAAVLQLARHAVIDPSHISAASAIGGAANLLLPGLIVLVTLVVGAVVFAREAPKIAEQL
jgi:ABC-2 type transport system permease protein